MNGKVVDIFVEAGMITKISEESLTVPDAKTFEASGLSISQGWVDVGVHFKDPGFEWLENLDSLAEAAAYGGFTHIIGLPNTSPVVQTKEGMAYFEGFSKFNAVQLHNLAAVTKDCKGEDFTDMIDLSNHGAVGFSDGKEVIENSDIFFKTLQYLEPLDKPLLVKSRDKYLSMYGQMHEGVTSTLLGMKGIPSAAEELMIARNLKLLEYSEVRSSYSLLHFSTISTKESVRLIREAKEKGLPVSCDVAAHNLEFTDESLVDFDTNLKVYPPFRTQEDINALLEGLGEGVIDFVVSDHNAWDEEHKNLEFGEAEFGVIGLQTSFSIILKKLGLDDTLDKIVYNPKRLFKIKEHPIKEGEKADFTLFSTEETYQMSEQMLKSSARNSPFLGVELRGKAKAVYNNGIFKELIG